MELRISASPSRCRDVLYTHNQITTWKKQFFMYGFGKANSPQKKIGTVRCSNNPDNNGFSLPEAELLSSKVVYSVAPAMGHNKESHPECNARVPAIIGALEKMRLTSEFRSLEVVELQKFRSAKIDDIASVHERVYVCGLEKASSSQSNSREREEAENKYNIGYLIADL